MAEAGIKAVGIGGAMELTDGVLHIKRAGATGFVLHGLKGRKSIPVGRIAGVELRLPSFFANGYLRLSVEGGAPAGGGILDAAQDECSLLFKRDQATAFEQLHAELMRSIA